MSSCLFHLRTWTELLVKLDPLPAFLTFATRGGLAHWLMPILNASLKEGVLPAPLKETIIRLDLKDLGSFRPEIFFGKVIKYAVVKQLRWFLEDTGCLDPSQSDFRPGYVTESTLLLSNMVSF